MEFMEQDIDLEQELRLELEKLDQIFLADHHDLNQSAYSDRLFSPQDNSNHNNNHRLSYSAYELAEAEIEKEELHDKLQILLSKTEDSDQQILELKKYNFELKSRHDQYQRENERLLQRIQELETTQLNGKKNGNKNGTSHSYGGGGSGGGGDDDQLHRTEEEFRQLEFKLAETRSKLARTQQAYDDLSLAKDSALIELEKERMIRLHVEKERDAYSAAYEQSLLHFEKWTSKSKSKYGISR